MTADGFCLFDTAIGACGIAWTARGIAGIHLPEPSEQHTTAARRLPIPGPAQIALPDALAMAVEAIGGHLRGEPADLAAIALDMTALPAFHRQVYAVARTVPSGTTWSYRQLAARVGAA